LAAASAPKRKSADPEAGLSAAAEAAEAAATVAVAKAVEKLLEGSALLEADRARDTLETDVLQAKPASKKASPLSDPGPSPEAPAAPKRKSAPKADPEAGLSAAAKAAIAAVAKAVEKLPEGSELLESGAITKMVAGGGGWGGGGGADTAPENHGSKDYPKGHPDCLMKYTFVISGVLDSMHRHEATDYIKQHGGRVTSGVTGKTSFLLCGALTCSLLHHLEK
jgi:NAD-dependent DNA ligase